MGNNIFVSYKYSDSQVQNFPGNYSTIVRDYVNKIEELLDEKHDYRGEHDDEDLSMLSEDEIESRLRDKMFYTSVTIVLISKGMKESKSQKDQWIPWEISYSLKEKKRESGNSHSNAILAVVLPDADGRYDYYIQDNSCPYCNCRTLKTDFLFEILEKNMFNIKKPEHSNCSYHNGRPPFVGDSSYIYSVKWIDFVSNTNDYIDKAKKINQKIDDYNITKKLK